MITIPAKVKCDKYYPECKAEINVDLELHFDDRRIPELKLPADCGWVEEIEDGKVKHWCPEHDPVAIFRREREKEERYREELKKKKEEKARKKQEKKAKKNK